MAYVYKTCKVNGKTKLVHRQVAAAKLGRPLARGEQVHHINGDKHDNRPENLEVLSSREHLRHHKQKHPTVKTCVICGVEFEPHPTKRKRAEACAIQCGRRLLWMRRRNEEVPFPEPASALVGANARAA